MSLTAYEDDNNLMKSVLVPYDNGDIFKENSANYINGTQILKQCRTHDKFIKGYENITPSKADCKSGSEIARKRWRMLAKALNKPAQTSTEEEVSVRRFTSFDIITSQPLIINNANETATWHLYSSQQYSVIVRQPNKPLTPCALIGFNNTGNICVWPSEEALAVFVLENIDIFKNTWVLELGGGLSCLAGLLLAKYGNLSGIRLTDGNPVTVDNIRQTVGQNEVDCFVKCSVLKWEEDYKLRIHSEKFKYNFILCADCLFFDDFHEALIESIWFYLSNTGTALIMAPDRSNTLKNFIVLAEQFGFTCCLYQKYNERIWQKHLTLKESDIYNENIHYPILLKLTKPHPFQ